MASEIRNIKLFSKKFQAKLRKSGSYLLFKIWLLPLLSWLDHSILKLLVEASKSKLAIKMLKDFESSIDYTQPITSYPIPAPSQLIVPLDDSEYALVATKCDCNFEEVDLQQIANIRNTLVEKWEVTEMAIQLVALHIESHFLYWIVPQCVATVIEECSMKFERDLWESGVIMTSVFYSSPVAVDKNTVWNQSYPFYFLYNKVGKCPCIIRRFVFID